MILSYDDEKEYWRLVRLLEAALYIAKKSPDLACKIVRLHDHEGSLSVFFNRVEMDVGFFKILDEAWAAQNEQVVTIVFEGGIQ